MSSGSNILQGRYTKKTKGQDIDSVSAPFQDIVFQQNRLPDTVSAPSKTPFSTMEIDGRQQTPQDFMEKTKFPLASCV